MAKPAFLWAVRGAVGVIAVVFIIVGIVNGGAHDVLVKAVNICQECIGLG
ncbi:MAG: thioredoxin [Clostridiales bacterium]|nr:thioredoxin [Clostridiales bacterium]